MNPSLKKFIFGNDTENHLFRLNDVIKMGEIADEIVNNIVKVY